MSKDNKRNLKADHGQHNGNQQPKRRKFSLISFMSVAACLITLLLIASCQPQHAQTFTELEVINHD